MKREMVANRVFVAYPWKTYKGVWEAIITDIHKKYPLHLIAIGRNPGQPAAQLLAKILSTLGTSSVALMDASTGNPNVSLEYGHAKAILKEEDVFLFLDEDSNTPTGPGTPIISDLAGAMANKYKISDSRLRDSLVAICNRHPFVKRFNKFCRQRSYRGGSRKFLMRIIRQLDGKDSVLRRELIDDIIHESRKTEAYVVAKLRELHNAGLITITRGNKNSSRIHISG